MKEIQLNKGQVALVDDEDFDWLNKFKWYAQWNPHTKSYYAQRTHHLDKINGKEINKTVRMHRLIMDAPKGKVVDHINHNPLDNRRSNIRIVSNRQNGQNLKTKKTSCFPGVSWNMRYKKWVAQIRINGKSKHLGYFEGTLQGELKAAMAYECACKELIGEELVCKVKA